MDELPLFGTSLSKSNEYFKKCQKPLYMRTPSSAVRDVCVSRSSEQSAHEFVKTHYDVTPQTSISDTDNTNRKKNELNCRLPNSDRGFIMFKELSNEAGDEFDVFAKSIAVQMRQLTPKDALEVQAEIQNVLVRKRLNALRKTHLKRIPSWDSDITCSSKSSDSYPASPHTS